LEEAQRVFVAGNLLQLPEDLQIANGRVYVFFLRRGLSNK